MTNHDELFQPEHVDEHVEQLARIQDPRQQGNMPGARTIAALQRIYQEDEAILERAWARLASVEVATSVPRSKRPSMDTPSLRGENTVQPPNFSRGTNDTVMPVAPPVTRPPERPPHLPQRWSTRLSALAAAVLLVGLVGGLVTGLILVRHGGSNTGAAPSSTATPTPPPASTPTFSDIEMKDAANGWARAANPANYTGANDTQILHTTDGGHQWKNVTPTSSTGGAQSGNTAFHPLSGGGPSVPVTDEFLTGSTAWVLLLPNHLFKTTDGGKTWQQETTPGENLREFTFLDALHGWVLTEEAGAVVVLRTSDGGATWTKMQQSGSAFPLDVEFTGMRFLNLTTGWVTSTTALAVTQDGGATWQPQHVAQAAGGTAAVQFFLPVFFTAQDGVLVGNYAAGAGQVRQQVNDGPASGAPGNDAIYVTHDGGTTWEGPNIVQGVVNESPPDFIDPLHGWMLDGTTSGLLTTSDGGRHWTQVPTSANFTTIGAGTLNFVSSQIGWAVQYGANLLLKTEDGGQTWTPLQVSISN